jgi:HAD superfamily phosphoserine phosphatase-like hydrolase
MLPSRAVGPLLIACDFDGTITSRDTLHVLVEEFGTRGLWAVLEPRLRSGEISIEQAMEEEFRSVRADPAEALAAVRRLAPVRAGFADMVAWAAARGDRLVVVSAGFRTVIDAVLADAGLGHLDVVANDIELSREGSRLVWTERGGRCELCARRCKRHDLRARLRDGETLVYLGDGISDRCAAGMAQVVFARDGLATWMTAENRPYRAFDDFHDVVRVLESLPAAA